MFNPSTVSLHEPGSTSYARFSHPTKRTLLAEIFRKTAFAPCIWVLSVALRVLSAVAIVTEFHQPERYIDLVMPRKLVLHFDVNETIMVGDPASKVDFDGSLNNILAKAAFLSEDKASWHDGSPLDLAQRDSTMPPLRTSFDVKGLRCYEANRGNASWPSSRFTECGPGRVYRPLFEELKEELRWKHEEDPRLAPEGHHFLLPAFFHTLKELAERRDVSVVIRTFGTDLPEVATSIQAFAAGEHPDFPGSYNRFYLASKEALWGLRRVDRGDVQSPLVLRRYVRSLGTEGWGDVSDVSDVSDPVEYVAECGPDHKIDEFLSSREIIGVRDDYHHWREQRFLPASGKPMWITLDEDVHHIFFDDNIHNKVNDSIVALRARRSSSEAFHCVSGEATRGLEGVFLVKAHAVPGLHAVFHLLYSTLLHIHLQISSCLFYLSCFLPNA